jgi:hypothetical protein
MMQLSYLFNQILRYCLIIKKNRRNYDEYVAESSKKWYKKKGI